MLKWATNSVGEVVLPGIVTYGVPLKPLPAITSPALPGSAWCMRYHAVVQDFLLVLVNQASTSLRPMLSEPSVAAENAGLHAKVVCHVDVPNAVGAPGTRSVYVLLCVTQ